MLLILTDQHKADLLGFAGNEVIRTPNLDRLAGESMVFDRAYVANPICTPNRSTIMTGRMPSAHGSRMNGVSLDFGAMTFARQLLRSGWRTAMIGKSHLQTMAWDRESFERYFDLSHQTLATADSRPDWDGWEHIGRFDEGGRAEMPDDYYGFEHSDVVVWHGDQCTGHYKQWLIEAGIDQDSMKGWDNAPVAADFYRQLYQTAVPVELYPTSYVAMRAVERIESWSRGDAPWLIKVSFNDPHHPFTPPGDYWDRYDPAEIPLPESFFHAHERSMPHHQRTHREIGMPQWGVDTWNPTEEQFRRIAVAQYGMIELIDDSVGEILAALDRSGQAEDTIVIFTSDHGDAFGDHGMILKHATHVPGNIRVPLTVKAPGHAAGRTGSLAGSIDLPHTILGLCGQPEWHDMQGRSLVPLLRSGSATVRDHVLIEEDNKDDPIGAGHPLRMRTIVTDEGRFTEYRGSDHGELFAHDRDRHEMDNLWGRREGAELEQHLRRRLLQSMMDHANETPRPDFMA